MKYIFLNLKRFDIPKEYSGVNSIASPSDWGKYIVDNTQEQLRQYHGKAKFAMYLPEAHLLSAINSKHKDCDVEIGCQSVYREDTQAGGNFGAFTTQRTANSMKAIGCSSTIIGHCEERKDKTGILREAGVTDTDAVNRILNKQIKAAVNAGMSVLYCIGENSDEMNNWQEVLKKQIQIGLEGVDTSHIAIAYEPIWAIGPGKTPPGKEYIEKIARFIKEETNGLPVVYGGGLKVDNANMLASIPEIDGGLIALTRFSGEIGFYPEEYLEIIRTYFS